MWVYEHHMRVGLFGEDRMENQRRSTRLSAAGRANHRKMLAQQLVDHDERPLRWVAAQAANSNAWHRRLSVHRRNVLCAHRFDDGTEDGEARDPSPKRRTSIGTSNDLTQEIDRQRRAQQVDVVKPDRVDNPDDVRRSPYLDEGSDDRLRAD